MAETLVKFDEAITAPSGARYFAHAAGKQVDGGLWQGWLEFLPVDEESETLASGRETTQPNRADLEYWAQGLTKVYLEGALARAISLAEGPPEAPDVGTESPRFTSPARRAAPPSTRAPLSPRPILNPFEVYLQGEDILRSELNALSRDHVEAIVNAYQLLPDGFSSQFKGSTNTELVEAIVERVRDSRQTPAGDSGVTQPRA